MIRTVVAGTDGSPTAARALDAAFGWARTWDAALHVLVAYRPLSDHEVHESRRGVPPALRTRIDSAHHARELLGRVAKVAAEAGVPAELYARVGQAGPALVQLAREVGADLVVVGSRGMTGRGMNGMARRLGSVPNHVTHHAPCSVLVVATDA